jgi:cytochrome c oxidase subunit 4
MKTNLQSKRAMVCSWISLLALLFLMIAASYIKGEAISADAILSLAILQMLLVAVVFMHLCVSPKIFWTFAAAGFFWLAIMFALMGADYLTRDWH